MAAATTIAAVVAAVASVAGAASAIYSGEQQKKAAEYNAKVYEQQAQAAKDKAAYDENRHRQNLRKILSAQGAIAGSSGVEISSGSPLLASLDTVGEGELDALAIRYGGDLEAVQAKSAAKLSKMQGRTAQTASYFQAGQSLLSGASTIARNYK